MILAVGIALTGGAFGVVFWIFERARDFVGQSKRVFWTVVSFGVGLIAIGYIAAVAPVWIAGVVIAGLTIGLGWWKVHA